MPSGPEPTSSDLGSIPGGASGLSLLHNTGVMPNFEPRITDYHLLLVRLIILGRDIQIVQRLGGPRGHDVTQD